MIQKCLKILLLPLVASFLPYMACELFNSNRPHGLLSFDVLFLVLLFCLDSKQKKIRVFATISTVVYAIVGGGLEFYIVASFYLLLIWLTALTKKNAVRIIVFIACLLIVLISDAGVFFYNTFAMSMADAWGVSKFFWWGLALFLAIPYFQVSLEFFFARNLVLGSNALKISPIAAVIIVVLVCATHFVSGQFQKRQPILEFGVKEFVWQLVCPDVVGHNPMLQEDIKDAIPLMDLSDLKISTEQATVMILVESWGVNKDVAITRALLAPYSKLENKSFWGIGLRKESFTQAAEIEDFHIDSRKTIPALFKENNFKTIYLHGYEGSFYKRNENYEKYGFETLLFKENFDSLGLASCKYGFTGICDSILAIYVDSLLNDSIPKFIYWTTLDGHLPYENQELASPSPNCKSLKLKGIDCVYFTRQENTARYIANLIGKHPNVRFIVRGDHRPPGSIVNPHFSSNYYYRWVPTVIVDAK